MELLSQNIIPISSTYALTSNSAKDYVMIKLNNSEVKAKVIKNQEKLNVSLLKLPIEYNILPKIQEPKTGKATIINNSGTFLENSIQITNDNNIMSTNKINNGSFIFQNNAFVGISSTQSGGSKIIDAREALKALSCKVKKTFYQEIEDDPNKFMTALHVPRNCTVNKNGEKFLSKITLDEKGPMKRLKHWESQAPELGEEDQRSYISNLYGFFDCNIPEKVPKDFKLAFNPYLKKNGQELSNKDFQDFYNIILYGIKNLLDIIAAEAPIGKRRAERILGSKTLSKKFEAMQGLEIIFRYESHDWYQNTPVPVQWHFDDYSGEEEWLDPLFADFNSITRFCHLKLKHV